MVEWGYLLCGENLAKVLVAIELNQRKRRIRTDERKLCYQNVASRVRGDTDFSPTVLKI